MDEIENLKKKFSLANLEPKVKKGFGFMVLVKPSSYSDWRQWTEKNDPDEQQSAYTLLPQKGPGCFGGELNAVLFKDRTVAETFLKTVDCAHQETGVLPLKSANLDKTSSAQRPPQFIKKLSA